MPNDNELQVHRAVDQWFAVLNAILTADPEPFAALYSRKDHVIYMGAESTYQV